MKREIDRLVRQVQKLEKQIRVDQKLHQQIFEEIQKSLQRAKGK